VTVALHDFTVSSTRKHETRWLESCAIPHLNEQEELHICCL
jgi:hypothetical protein